MMRTTLAALVVGLSVGSLALHAQPAPSGVGAWYTATTY